MAERQLSELHAYIAERASEERADAYIGRILAYCSRFDLFPQRGARRDDLLVGLRTVGFERRVTIAFLIDSEAVLIEGVFYGGQDFAVAFQG